MDVESIGFIQGLLLYIGVPQGGGDFSSSTCSYIYMYLPQLPVCRLHIASSAVDGAAAVLLGDFIYLIHIHCLGATCTVLEQDETFATQHLRRALFRKSSIRHGQIGEERTDQHLVRTAAVPFSALNYVYIEGL